MCVSLRLVRNGRAVGAGGVARSNAGGQGKRDGGEPRGGEWARGEFSLLVPSNRESAP